jgi:hypothetical protein
MAPMRAFQSMMVLIAGLGFPRVAGATLGGDAASVAEDARRLGAGRATQPLAIGERHLLALPSGIEVREYLSPDGFVYAVSWRGPRMPDLRALLGASFAQLASPRSRSGSHHRVVMTGADLVFESSGHGRWFTGRAIIPSRTPAPIATSTIE